VTSWSATRHRGDGAERGQTGNVVVTWRAGEHGVSFTVTQSPTGFNYTRAITIDHTKVPNTIRVIPVLFSERTVFWRRSPMAQGPERPMATTSWSRRRGWGQQTRPRTGELQRRDGGDGRLVRIPTLSIPPTQRSTFGTATASVTTSLENPDRGCGARTTPGCGTFRMAQP